jgi:hypothetical protein
MITTIIAATTRFCSTLALVACVPTTLETTSEHPSHAAPSAALPLPEVLAAHLSPASLPRALARTDGAHHHDHQAAAPSAEPTSEVDGTHAAQRWTCPMHPEVSSDGPGSCPICGMHLVEKKDPPPPGAQP